WTWTPRGGPATRSRCCATAQMLLSGVRQNPSDDRSLGASDRRHTLRSTAVAGRSSGVTRRRATEQSPTTAAGGRLSPATAAGSDGRPTAGSDGRPAAGSDGRPAAGWLRGAGRVVHGEDQEPVQRPAVGGAGGRHRHRTGGSRSAGRRAVRPQPGRLRGGAGGVVC